MTDAYLDLLGAQGEIIVEGHFTKHRLYRRALAALREGQRLSYSLDESGTLAGAALFARMPDLAPPPATEYLTPLFRAEICAHRERWRAQLEF
jgi:hypothetical protein